MDMKWRPQGSSHREGKQLGEIEKGTRYMGQLMESRLTDRLAANRKEHLAGTSIKHLAHDRCIAERIRTV